VTKPTVPEVRAAVEDYYCLPEMGNGGSLHIVVDDGNIETHHVQFCRDYAAERNDAEGVRIADLLLQMSKTQRKKVAETHRGHEVQFERGVNCWDATPEMRALRLKLTASKL
jgi:hypothetical protein